MLAGDQETEETIPGCTGIVTPTLLSPAEQAWRIEGGWKRRAETLLGTHGAGAESSRGRCLGLLLARYSNQSHVVHCSNNVTCSILLRGIRRIQRQLEKRDILTSSNHILYHEQMHYELIRAQGLQC
jgi:hypothetical protein